MNNHYFQNKPRFVFFLFMIAIASIAVRALFHYDFHESALLYVGIPFAIALVLVGIRSPNANISWTRVYLNRLIDAFIIMLGSSVVLFEGFVCVVMFMPIYLVILLIVFISDYLVRRSKTRKGYLSAHLFPVLLLISASEGITPELSFDRQEQVTFTQEIPADIATIKQHLQQPMALQKDRPWFLYLFPMPYAIHAGTLSTGDVHEIYFRYYRWFVTNVHEGKMLLELTDVGEKSIKATFLSDTSYISHYLHLLDIDIVLEETTSRHTRVTLQISYERTLDPYWYFSPVTRYGVTKMAQLLMKEVIAREST